MTTAVAWKTEFLIIGLMNKHLRFTDSGQCQRKSSSFRVRCIICDYLAKKLLQLPSAAQGQIFDWKDPCVWEEIILAVQRYHRDNILYKNKKEPETNSLTQSQYCSSLQERSSTEIAKLD